MALKDRPVGVFDSGVGGISVLKKLMAALPNENFVYYGDIKNAPFGTKSFNQVRKIACDATEFLIDKQVKAIVLGCNTATTTSLPYLQSHYFLPIIGVAPPIEQAQKFLRGGKVFVMATPATLKTDYILQLQKKYENTVLIPCAGLMELVENHDIDTPRLHAYLNTLFLPYKNEQADVIVLGCTHYPFAQKAIAAHFPSNPVFMDSSYKAADELKKALSSLSLFSSSTEKGNVQFFTSGTESHLIQMKSFLSL